MNLTVYPPPVNFACRFSVNITTFAKHVYPSLRGAKRRGNLCNIRTLMCQLIKRCLQFIGIKIINQLFFWDKSTNTFVRLDPVVVVDKTFQFRLPLGGRIEFCYARNSIFKLST